MQSVAAILGTDRRGVSPDSPFHLCRRRIAGAKHQIDLPDGYSCSTTAALFPAGRCSELSCWTPPAATPGSAVFTQLHAADTCRAHLTTARKPLPVVMLTHMLCGATKHSLSPKEFDASNTPTCHPGRPCSLWKDTAWAAAAPARHPTRPAAAAGARHLQCLGGQCHLLLAAALPARRPALLPSPAALPLAAAAAADSHCRPDCC